MNSQLRAALKLAQALKHQPTQAGFTLLESLVAIVAITFVTVSITPPIFIAVATRFQNQKAEQATYLAQGQIEKVRVLVERGSEYTIDPEKYLPAADTTADAGQIASVSAPTSSAPSLLDSSNDKCSNPYQGQQIPVKQALAVDVNSDCEVDFYVQIFRSKNVTSGAQQNTEQIGGTSNHYPVSFAMGVRVYAAHAKFGQLTTKPAALTFTSGEGDMRTQPLAVMYTDVTRSDAPFSFNRYNGLSEQKK